MFVGWDHGRLFFPTMCWLPGLHRRSYGPRLVASSGLCTAAELSILLTSCLAAVGGCVIKCCTTVCGGSGGGFFLALVCGVCCEFVTFPLVSESGVVLDCIDS